MLELHRLARHTVVVDVVVGLSNGDGAGIVLSVAAAVGVVVGGDDIQRAGAVRTEIRAGQGVLAPRAVRLVAEDISGCVVGSGRAVLLDHVVGAVGRGEGDAIVVDRGGVVGRDRLGRQRIEGRRDGDHRDVQGDSERLAAVAGSDCGSDRHLAETAGRGRRVDITGVVADAAGERAEITEANGRGCADDRGDRAVVGAVAIAAAQRLVSCFDEVAVAVGDRVAVVHLTGQVGRKRAGINNDIVTVSLALVIGTDSNIGIAAVLDSDQAIADNSHNIGGRGRNRIGVGSSVCGGGRTNRIKLRVNILCRIFVDIDSGAARKSIGLIFNGNVLCANSSLALTIGHGASHSVYSLSRDIILAESGSSSSAGQRCPFASSIFYLISPSISRGRSCNSGGSCGEICRAIL